MSDLNFDVSSFPPPDRYPLNSSESTVFRWVRQELQSGPTLVVTGFSSLEFLVKTLSAVPPEHSIRDWDKEDRIPREFRPSLVRWAQSIRPEGDLFAAQAEDASRYQLANLARRWLEIAEPALLPLRESWRKRRFLSWDRPEIYRELKNLQLTTRHWESFYRELDARPTLEQRIRVVSWGVGLERS